MDRVRFRQLYDAARTAARASGDDLGVRAKARRQLRQTLDILSLKCEPPEWAAVEWARKNGFPEFDVVVRQNGL